MRQGLTTTEAGRLGALAASETIARKKQERINTWNVNPKLCKFCNSPITYKNRRNNFCDHSCSAAFNNKGVRRHGDAQKDCLNCKNKTTNDKFCSQNCMGDFWWKESKAELIKNGIDNSSNNLIGKKYLIELYGGKCQACGLNEWQGKPMPLVLDHIDGNPYNDILVNLRVICNNCDALSPTYKGRNKGNGRFKRAERYKYEKEAVGNIDGFKWKQ